MKFFSEIFTGDIHISPDTKIIPKEQAETLQDAFEIIEKTKKDAKEFKKKLTIQAKEVKEQAYAEGFAEGLQELNEHILLIDNLAKNLSEDVKKANADS